MNNRLEFSSYLQEERLRDLNSSPGPVPVCPSLHDLVHLAGVSGADNLPPGPVLRGLDVPGSRGQRGPSRTDD